MNILTFYYHIYGNPKLPGNKSGWEYLGAHGQHLPSHLPVQKAGHTAHEISNSHKLEEAASLGCHNQVPGFSGESTPKGGNGKSKCRRFFTACPPSPSSTRAMSVIRSQNQNSPPPPWPLSQPKSLGRKHALQGVV